MTTPTGAEPVTEPCPHCGCPVAPAEWFLDEEGMLCCTCCAIRDKCDPNDPDCTCRREADAGTESAGIYGRLRDHLEAAANEGRNVLPDATDDQAAVIEAWAKGALDA